MNIEAIYPNVFGDSEQVQAIFTLKNDHISSENRAIHGLNLGFNTEEAPEIIESNRDLLIEKFDLDKEWIAFANQVHSNRVKVVVNGGTFANTDALITQVPGLALAIQVADCAAILIADENAGIVAAIHAGWRGAAGDIVPRTVQKMVELDGNPDQFRAFISPCISQTEFEVGSEVAEQFPVQFVDDENFEKPHINLKAFLKNQLADLGLMPENIEIHAGCTVRDKDFYSYRREGEKSGRMMAIIRLR